MFLGKKVGARLDELEVASTPWTVTRTITAPDLTYRLLRREPAFSALPSARLREIASLLAFLFQHTRVWHLVWVESVPGPGIFEDSRTIRAGTSKESVAELARTVGMDVELEGGLWVATAKAKLSAEWSKLTRSTVCIGTETETRGALTLPVPSGGMDIALWQLESRLTRRLALRPGVRLSPDPQPAWVEMAMSTPSPRSTYGAASPRV
ncbi:hypothetical protein AB0K18_40495 [Nonomuraea sp. NPDC049421]|uniref:hypothetical protein n=1 Tax=Nonomuraea sp. NPDC049421 TaxID=3155275 RepID=UPI003448D9C8